MPEVLPAGDDSPCASRKIALRYRFLKTRRFTNYLSCSFALIKILISSRKEEMRKRIEIGVTNVSLLGTHSVASLVCSSRDQDCSLYRDERKQEVSATDITIPWFLVELRVYRQIVCDVKRSELKPDEKRHTYDMDTSFSSSCLLNF